MFGGNGSASLGDQIMDQHRHLLRLIIDPVRPRPARRANVEMDIAVAEMTKGVDPASGKGGFDPWRGADEEARHVGDRHRNVVLGRRPILFFGLRNAVAQPPQ